MQPLATVLLLLLGVAVTSPRLASQGVDAPRGRPNILFCLADDWGWPHAGALGDEVVKTPTFDRLAREGVLFERAWISSPSCTPSRNAVLTGQQFYRLGEGANLHSTLDPRHPNFMFLLREAGYRIGHWRKAWGPGRWQAGGYTEDPCGPRSTFEEFLAGRDPDQPFCFWFGTSDPHRGYEKGSGAEAGIDPSKIRVPAFLPDHPEVRGDIADYYFEVQRWDREVGEALALLEAHGELDDTIVVMTGDHGMPFPRCKGNLYDWGSRVPLAVRWGKHLEPWRESEAFVSLTDLAPTFLEAARVPVPEEMTGRSLLTLMTDPDAPGALEGRDFVVFGRERHVPAQKMPSMDGYPARAIRTDRWLLIHNFAPERWPAGVPELATHPMGVHADCDDGPTKALIVGGKDGEFADAYRLCFARREPLELYDCRADPDQVENLVSEEHFARIEPVLDELAERLHTYLARTEDPRAEGSDGDFDVYPYRAGYLQKRIDEFRETHPELFVDPSLRAPEADEGGLLLRFAWAFGRERHATLEAFREAVDSSNREHDEESAEWARKQLALTLCETPRCYVIYDGLDAGGDEYETKAIVVEASGTDGVTLADVLWQVGEHAFTEWARVDHRYPGVLFRHSHAKLREDPRWTPRVRSVLRDERLPVFSIHCGS